MMIECSKSFNLNTCTCLDTVLCVTIRCTLQSHRHTFYSSPAAETMDCQRHDSSRGGSLGGSPLRKVLNFECL